MSRAFPDWPSALGAALLAAAIGAFWVVSGCSCDDDDRVPVDTFDTGSTTFESSPIAARPSIGWGTCTLTVDKNAPDGGPVTVYFYAGKAKVVSVTSPVDFDVNEINRYRFRGVRAGQTITIYLKDAKLDEGCSWLVGVEEFIFTEGYWVHGTIQENSASVVHARGAGPPTVAEAGSALTSGWFVWLTFGTTSLDTVDAAACQQMVDFLQTGDVVLAVRVPQDPGLAAGDGWRMPVVFRGDDRPTLTMESGSDVLVTLPVEYRPDWFAFANANLPAAPGEMWTVIGPATSPRVTCPGDLSEWAWSANLRFKLDLGGQVDPYLDHVLESYVCYRGQQEPFATAAATDGGDGAVRAEGTTCVGPIPTRFVDWFGSPDPPYLVTRGGLARAQPGGRAQARVMVLALTASPVEVSLSADSTLGIPWQLYNGNGLEPDLDSPITGPLSIEGDGYRGVWLVADVPAGLSGLDTTTVTAVATGQKPSWTTLFYQVGPWTAPPAGVGWSRWVAVGSHAPGANGSKWRADLGLYNPGASGLDAEVRLHGPGGVTTLPVTVPGRGQVVVRDVLGAMGFTGAGPLEVWGPGRLVVTSRSYNQVSPGAACFPGGTLGQALDGAGDSGTLVAGQRAWIPQLVENAAFRSNIGLTNTGSSEASVRVHLHDGTGAELVSYEVTLAPGEWKQDNRPFANRAGREDLDAGYAVVEVLSGSGVTAYGSVVDNLTNDPTTNPMRTELQGGAKDVWIPVAVHAPGANQSQWRTTLGLLNPGTAQASATVTVHTSGGTLSSAYTVPAGGQLILDDLVGQLGGEGAGPLHVTSSQPLLVTSRTYTQIGSGAACLPGGTLGQALAPVTPEAALALGEAATIPHLMENGAFRSNIGLANVGDAPARVAVRLHDGAGALLADYEVALSPHEWKQENRPFSSRAGRNDLDAAWASVEVVEGSGVLAYGSVVDNVTNDPTTVVPRPR